MADTIFTRALAQAAAIQGSNQALASVLRVPATTLSRWSSGRAQMPVRAFRHVIELLLEHEQSAGADPGPEAATRDLKVTFRAGNVVAHCVRCGGSQFAAESAALRMMSVLRCCACHHDIKHGELLTQLATQMVRHTRTQAALRKSKRPALASSQNEAPRPSANISGLTGR